jgi:hypothetical protein
VLGPGQGLLVDVHCHVHTFHLTKVMRINRNTLSVYAGGCPDRLEALACAARSWRLEFSGRLPAVVEDVLACWARAW